MHRRVFIGIELPPQVKKRLFQAIQEWQDLPVKWGSEENMHITLSFLGYVNDEQLGLICEKVHSLSENYETFDICFKAIELGPDKAKPKMVWLAGEPNETLKKIQENIEKELDIFQHERREFRPHVTLGRIRKIKWEALPEVPVVEKKFSVCVPADCITIFESVMEDGKRKYLALENCPLI